MRHGNPSQRPAADENGSGPPVRPTPSVWLRRGVVAAFAVAGLLVTWSLDRDTVERANRLHRNGRSTEAAALLETHRGERTDDDALRYNLGTALLAAGGSEGAEELLAATDAGDGEIRAHANYNAGLLHLRLAIEGAEPDSLRSLAAAAVEANRSALLLRPDDEDTKWNLAMSQRLLDSIDAGSRRSGDEQAESALEADEVVRSENVLEVDEESELPDEAPLRGEEEARAERADEGPLSELEAVRLMTDTHLDPALMLQKLLALEGRAFWGRRPGTRGPRR